MKVAVFGASGIIGQHMMLCVPAGVQALFFRRRADRLFLGCDVANEAELLACLDEHKPQVVINLAGESNTDTVERSPGAFSAVNVKAPSAMLNWCKGSDARLIHISSQSVFSGDSAPYGPDTGQVPQNKYGFQKAFAEQELKNNIKPWTWDTSAVDRHCTIIRPTFTIGIRPIQTGRPNPAEQMISGKQSKQVADRWFSPLYARDAARGIWSALLYGTGPEVIHLGEPIRVSRFDIAKALKVEVEAVSHDDFPGIAPRPVDTTYAAESARFWTPLKDAAQKIKGEWLDKQMLTLNERAREIALFLKLTEDEALVKLSKGFGPLHNEVSEDFRKANPSGDDALLDWYRRTEAYIWELSAYHCDQGWNYDGMCRGIVERLKNEGHQKILCLGDGIGDLTLALRRAGMNAVYHDLAGSRTAEFAHFRFYMHGFEGPSEMTDGWNPQFSEGYDAVLSLDFLEHVTDVPAWTAAVRRSLRPGGLFCAQNAFAIGSGTDGSIPMHLACNDKYEQEWDPHLASLGFRQTASNWYEVAA